MIDRFNYLVQENSADTWNNIKKQFDVSGPAAIFVSFRYVINFKFDEKKDPSVQVVELNTKLDVLSMHGFTLDERIQAMIILSGLPQSWDSVQGAILANTPMNKLKIDTIMPILQEEWQRRQARHHKNKSSHLARTNIRGGPQRQQWQGPSNYNQQAGQQHYNNNYNKPTPYNKFGKKPNYSNNSNSNQKPNYNKPSGNNGPNWERNKQNRANKKKAKMLLMDQVKKLESNQKESDKKGKGKAPKTANLLARIDEEILLIDRMEDIDNYNERVFITLESDKTNKVVQMDIDEDAVSLGDDKVYLDARQFYADNDPLDGNYTKYGKGLLNKKLAKIPHTQ